MHEYKSWYHITYIMYTAKHSREKTFAVGIENDRSWENVHGIVVAASLMING